MNTYVAAFTNLTHTSTAYADAEGTQLSRAQIARRYSGDGEGESTAELLLCKTPTGVFSYAGTDHFVGKLRGRSGSFVFQHAGIVENGRFEGFGYVVPGSATGDLSGLRGRAFVKVGSSGEHALHLEVEV